MSISPPREGSRATSEGIIVSKYPDVCRSPEVPIPYTIVARQCDDANTASSVFMTGQRAHKQNSIVTKCEGDEPGTGLGVKSNTVSSICHRKEHSQTVRIEGQWATRHDDEWYMNNRNTIGKLVWPKHNQVFDPTPPIKEFGGAAIVPSNTADAVRSAPGAAALMRTGAVMSDTPPFAFQPGQQYAFRDTTGTFPRTNPSVTKPPAELPAPSNSPGGSAPQSPKVPPPNRWWSLVLELELIKYAFQRLATMPQRLEEAHQKDLQAQGRTPQAIENNLETQFKSTDFGHWYPGSFKDYAAEVSADPNAEQRLQMQWMVEEAKKRNKQPLEELTRPPEPAGRTPNNVSTKGKGRRRRNCTLRKYSQGCADAAPYSTPHHIVADRAFRAPGKEGALYKGGIPHEDGYCICVDGGTPVFKGPNANEHGLIHGIYNPAEALLGSQGNPKGTARLDQLEMTGVVAASAVTGCDPADLLKQLRDYHRNVRKLPGSTLFRADPTGRINVDPNSVGQGSGKSGSAGGL